MTCDHEDRGDALRSALAMATRDAFESGIPVSISLCLPCAVFQGQACPLCEIVTVLPSGVVCRERRGH